MTTKSIDEKKLQRMRNEMASAMRDLLGSGYTDDYYRSNAADFVGIALAFGACGVSEPTEKRERAKR